MNQYQLKHGQYSQIIFVMIKNDMNHLKSQQQLQKLSPNRLLITNPTGNLYPRMSNKEKTASEYQNSYLQQKQMNDQLSRNNSAFIKNHSNQNLQLQQRFNVKIGSKANQQTYQQLSYGNAKNYQTHKIDHRSFLKTNLNQQQKIRINEQRPKINPVYNIPKPQRRFQHFPFQEVYIEYVPKQVTYVEYVPVQRVKKSCYTIEHITQYSPKQIEETIIDYVPQETTKFRKQYNLVQKRIVHMPIDIEKGSQLQQKNNNLNVEDAGNWKSDSVQVKQSNFNHVFLRFENSVQLRSSQLANKSEIKKLIGQGKSTQRLNANFQSYQISPFKQLGKQIQAEQTQKPLVFANRLVTSDTNNLKFKQLIRSTAQSRQLGVNVNRSRPIRLPYGDESERRQAY